ncbi:beta-1,3-galactosyltransferase 1-like isoform X1 [Penaeus chinensis]|uniref:beta-1,3-galactosyltransferase 1-like isoform X1 n=2 Tax=Penaeus chinensis TaxID=139456 RepID=UPI001FB72006|nr:beta-1,3-galactosyltransferase 1-like isoform X1 [Penaeus chinensis]
MLFLAQRAVKGGNSKIACKPSFDSEVRARAPGDQVKVGRWQVLRRMPRRPRLPILVAYLCLFTLVFLLYVSARSPQQEVSAGNGPSKEAQPGEEGSAAKAATARGTKRKGRNKDQPVNPHDFHIIINNPKICNGDNAVSLLVQVSSAPGNFHRRRAIRDTWGGSSPLDASDARLVFLLGNPRDSRIQTQVVEESRTYGDILQEDFVDSYMNLTIKSVMGLKWASNHCPQARFLMKTDDDMFINIPSLLTYLQEASASTWITGCIKQKKAFMPVNADPGASLPPGHPPFVAGAGYVISGDLVGALYAASLRRRPIPVEDVYVTAHLARDVGVSAPVHDARFSCGEMVVDDCDLVQVFTGHRISPERMYHIWEKLNPNGITSPCFDF